MNFYSLVLSLIMAPWFLHAQGAPAAFAPTESRPADFVESEIRSSLLTMSIEEKASQLLFIGFKGTDFQSDIASRIKKIRPGGVIFFSRNIQSPLKAANTIALAQALSRKLTKWPLLVGVDQEGGSVARIKGGSLLPSAYAVGRSADSITAENLGLETGRMLAAIGFNLNFAPVLDLSDPQKKTFIGSRSYGNDPVRVSEISLAFSKGLLDGGVIPTTKHFPGHGNVSVDSHKDIPSKNDSLESLLSRDLQPYANMIEQTEASAIMVGHVALPNIDPSRTPASYSKPILTGILRDKLNFKGLVITDDLQMGGAAKGMTAGERAVKALQAGADMLMVVWDISAQRSAVEGIVKAVKNGTISLERLDESVRRILLLKIRYSTVLDKTGDLEQSLADALSSELLQKSARVVIRRIIDEELSNSALSIPSIPHPRIHILSTSSELMKSIRKSERNFKVTMTRISSKTSIESLAAAIAENSRALILYYMGGSLSRSVLSQLPKAAKKHLIVINPDVPAFATAAIGSRAVLNIGTRGPDTGIVLAEKFADLMSNSASTTQNGNPKVAHKENKSYDTN